MTGVNGYSYARPAGSMASKGMQYGGAAGNISNQYSNVGNTGMSKADLRNSGMAASAQYRANVDAQKTAEYSQQLSQTAQMYGISNFDPMMADADNNGVITKKEYNNMEKQLQMYAMQNMRTGSNGQSSSSGNVFGMLNSITDTAGNIMGAIKGDGTSGTSGFIETAGNWVKGLFG